MVDLRKVDLTLFLYVLVQQVETRQIVHANYAYVKFFVEDDFFVEVHKLRLKLAKELSFLESVSDASDVLGNGVSNFFGSVLLDVKEHQQLRNEYLRNDVVFKVFKHRSCRLYSIAH